MTCTFRDALACERGDGERHRQTATIILPPPGQGVAAATDYATSGALIRAGLALYPVAS